MLFSGKSSTCATIQYTLTQLYIFVFYCNYTTVWTFFFTKTFRKYTESLRIKDPILVRIPYGLFKDEKIIVARETGNIGYKRLTSMDSYQYTSMKNSFSPTATKALHVGQNVTNR